ncbi:MAG: hypothetical protein IT556_10050 [Acetobacteraceae bacterium]|nr:hypothetical protein [Acetobacteraceae bacterium]
MADATPTTALPPVTLEDFAADRAGFAHRLWKATTIGIVLVAIVLALMATFLV